MIHKRSGFAIKSKWLISQLGRFVGLIGYDFFLLLNVSFFIFVREKSLRRKE